MATTLTQLLTMARDRADMNVTTFVDDTMLTTWINMGMEELYDRVVAAFQDHYWNTKDFTLTGGSVANAQYALSGVTSPTFRSLRWLEWSPATAQRRMMKPWTLGEKDVGGIPRYRLLGGVIQIEPYEYAAGTYRLYYVGNPTALSSGSDVLDASLDTFRDYIVCVAAIKARVREESDVQDLSADLGRQIQRIDTMAAMRDQGHPKRVNDVSHEADGNPYFPWY